MFMHVLIWIWVSNWIYDALQSETVPSTWVTSAIGTGFWTQLPPTAHLHLSSAPKAIIIPPIPQPLTTTPSFLAALLYTLGFGTGLEAPLSPPLPSLRKLILLSVCLFLITSGKYIRSSATRAEGHGLGEVGGNSVTGKSLFLLALGGLFLVLSLLMCYYEKRKKKKTPKQWSKIADLFAENVASHNWQQVDSDWASLF